MKNINFETWVIDLHDTLKNDHLAGCQNPSLWGPSGDISLFRHVIWLTNECTFPKVTGGVDFDTVTYFKRSGHYFVGGIDLVWNIERHDRLYGDPHVTPLKVCTPTNGTDLVDVA